MTTIYVGVDDKKELISVLNDMMELGYFDWYDEESIVRVSQLSSVSYDSAYIRNYGEIQGVYGPANFFNRDVVYSVDVEE